jgi:hypothetical protein
MSRSNPTEKQPNPASRFYEWSGKNGNLTHYDKDKKEEVKTEIPFTFLLLDELATIKGWHDPSDSGIYSNEVRDTRGDVLVVKSFKGGTIAEGLYSQIKDRIKAQGGHFVANLYIAYRDQEKLVLGALQFKGAALHAWSDFRREHPEEVYKKAVSIIATKEGKKGSVTFQTPIFDLKDVSEKTNTEAKEIDSELQKYLGSYFKRTKVEQVQEPVGATASSSAEDDEIPF